MHCLQVFIGWPLSLSIITKLTWSSLNNSLNSAFCFFFQYKPTLFSFHFCLTLIHDPLSFTKFHCRRSNKFWLNWHGKGYCGNSAVTMVMGRNWPQMQYYHGNAYLSHGNTTATETLAMVISWERWCSAGIAVLSADAVHNLLLVHWLNL